jgi:hypothetical protein
MPTPSPMLNGTVRRLIDESRPKPVGDWMALMCKEDLDALFLCTNLVDIWALRADGAVLRKDVDRLGTSTDPETDPVVRYAVLVQGSRRYPELRAFLPERPPGATRCERCGGEGLDPARAGTGYPFCPACDGLGWSRSE